MKIKTKTLDGLVCAANCTLLLRHQFSIIQKRECNPFVEIKQQNVNMLHVGVFGTCFPCFQQYRQIFNVQEKMANPKHVMRKDVNVRIHLDEMGVKNKRVIQFNGLCTLFRHTPHNYISIC